MPEWNPRANELFVQAAEIDSPADRRLFLEQQCGGDAALQSQVESLLAAGGKIGSFLEKPAMPAPPSGDVTAVYRPLTEGPGTVIGPYKLLQHIGEGGFGAVYMAEQEHPVRRKVALKIIKPGMDTREVIARFESERQALAMMDHPNIARVFDAGATESGRPYFVMELVRGIPITEFCDRNKLPAEGRLGLFVAVCNAVQHAHHKGIIHRDIKPSNVMVTLHDGVPVVKVIDFGVAKATAQKLTERTLFTAYGQMVGTPAYMSPEQAEMSGLDIDTRSDIYSLGVLLYELLTGTTPLDSKQLRQAGYAEIQRLIREEEAPRPSTRLSSLGGEATALATNRSTDVKRLSQLLRGELDWIVMRCLEKDRARRYDGAATLAKDVQRYLTGDAVEACPPTLGYRLKKAYRRNKATVLTGGLLALVMLAATTVSLAFGVAARRAESDAVAARNAEADHRDAAVQAEKEAAEQRDNVKTAYAQLQEQQRQQRAEQYSWDMQTLPSFWEAGSVVQVRYLLNRYPPELRGFEWHYWNKQTREELSTHRLPDVKSLGAVKFSQDGSRVAQVASVATLPGRSVGPTAEVWDVVTRRKLLTYEMTTETFPPREGPPTIGSSWSATTSPSHFSADGKRLALTRDTRPRDPKTGSPTRIPFTTHFQVVDVDSGKPLLDHDDRKEERLKIGLADSVAFSPDGRTVAVVGTVGSPGGPNAGSAVHIWNLEGGAPPVTIACIGFVNSPYSPDGSRIVVRRRDGNVFQSVVCDTSTGKEVATWAHVENRGRTYSPDGVRLAYVVADPSAKGGTEPALKLHIWDVVAGKELHSLALPLGTDGFASSGFARLSNLFFSRDGSRLVVTGPSATGTVLLALFDPVAGKRLATMSVPSTQNQSGRPDPPAPIFSPDGKQLALAGDNVIRTWDATTGRPLRTLRGHPNSVVACSFTATGQLLSLAIDGTLKEWDVKPAEPVVLPLAQRSSNQIVVSADGRWVATGVAITGRVQLPPEANSDIQLWDVAGKRSTTITPRACAFRRSCQLALSSNGQRLALIRLSLAGISPSAKPDPEDTRSGDLTVWDVATGSELYHTVLPASELAGVSGLAISPDGSTVAVGIPLPVGKGDTVIRLYDVASGREVRSIRGAESLYRMMWFSPDGKRLAALGTPLPYAGLPGQIMPKSTADLPPPKLAVWDVTTGDSIFTLDIEMRDVGVAVAWSPDGKRLAVLKPASETLIQFYDAATGKRLTAIESPNRGAPPGANIRNITFSPDGRRIAAEMPSHAGSSGPVVCVWDAESGKEMLTLRPDLGPVSNPGGAAAHVAFSPDGHRLLYFKHLRETGVKSDEKVVVTTWDATPLPEQKP